MAERRKIKTSDMMTAHVPKAFNGVEIAKVKGKSGAKIRDYADRVDEFIEHGYGFVLWGMPRTGKTAAAVCLLKAVLGNGGTALFMPSDECAERIDQKPYDSERTIRERAEEVDLLVIDDLGEEPDGQYIGWRIVSLVRNRLDAGKSVVITTNYRVGETSGQDRGAMSGKYGRRFVQQMTERMIPVMFSASWHQEEVEALEDFADEKRG